MRLLTRLFAPPPPPLAKVLQLTMPCPVCLHGVRCGFPPPGRCVGCRGSGRVVPARGRILREWMRRWGTGPREGV
jgi:hypothetical protein